MKYNTQDYTVDEINEILDHIRDDEYIFEQLDEPPVVWTAEALEAHETWLEQSNHVDGWL